jgi:hypothetical protein
MGPYGGEQGGILPCLLSVSVLQLLLDVSVIAVPVYRVFQKELYNAIPNSPA